MRIEIGTIPDALAREACELLQSIGLVASPSGYDRNGDRLILLLCESRETALERSQAAQSLLSEKLGQFNRLDVVIPPICTPCESQRKALGWLYQL